MVNKNLKMKKQKRKSIRKKIEEEFLRDIGNRTFTVEEIKQWLEKYDNTRISRIGIYKHLKKIEEEDKIKLKGKVWYIPSNIEKEDIIKEILDIVNIDYKKVDFKLAPSSWVIRNGKSIIDCIFTPVIGGFKNYDIEMREFVLKPILNLCLRGYLQKQKRLIGFKKYVTNKKIEEIFKDMLLKSNKRKIMVSFIVDTKNLEDYLKTRNGKKYLLNCINGIFPKK